MPDSDCLNPRVMMPDGNMQNPKREGAIYTKTRVSLEKNLASPDKAKREKAMSFLSLWLTSQKEIREEELAMIWKGLLFCLMHAETSAAQEDLVERMASLMGKLDVELCLLFFKVFLTSLRNEWGSLDDISLGRFQLLLKQNVSHMFSVMKRSDWELKVVSRFTDALAERALLLQNGAIGINVYISNVFLDKLRHFLPIPPGIFRVLVEPFWEALSKGCHNELAEEISEKIFFVICDHGSRGLVSDIGSPVNDNREKGCFGDLAFDLALSIQTKSSALPAFASHSNSLQLRLIVEKFNCLANFGHPQVSTSGNVMTAYNEHIETQNTSYLSERVDRIQNSLEQVATRNVGRLSKRIQKLVFSPQTVEDVYIKRSSKKTGGVQEEKQTKIVREEMKMRQASQGKSTTSKKSEVDIASSQPVHNLENAKIISIEGPPPNQDIVTSNEAEIKYLLAANDDGRLMVDPVISNLAERFESIADQSSCCEAGILSIASTPLSPSPLKTGGRKRKSFITSHVNALDSESPTSAKEHDVTFHDPSQEGETRSIDNLSAKKAKKVHFSLQHNIVWQPSTPLPPYDVRVPSAAAPRGSALKKGVPPGPIIKLIEVSNLPKKKNPTPQKAPSAHLKIPKRVKKASKIKKGTKKGCLSPG